LLSSSSSLQAVPTNRSTTHPPLTPSPPFSSPPPSLLPLPHQSDGDGFPRGTGTPHPSIPPQMVAFLGYQGTSAVPQLSPECIIREGHEESITETTGKIPPIPLVLKTTTVIVGVDPHVTVPCLWWYSSSSITDRWPYPSSSFCIHSAFFRSWIVW